MKNKKNIILIGSFVVVALVSFYAGGVILGSKKSSGLPNISNQFAQNGQFGQGRGTKMGNGNVFGQIIAKDATSITVELKAPNIPGETTTGTGSKIVFYTNTTAVTKTSTGTIADLSVGKNVNVQGTANPDGSVSATSVQIR